jgi:hypothetical protein
MENEIAAEHQLLLRDLRQAARTVLDIRGGKKFAVEMFLITLRHEALERNQGKREAAAKMLGEHRNTFTRGLPEYERKNRERFVRRPPLVRIMNSGASRMQATLR